MATGYKYNLRKVICFLSSRDFESSKPGEPYYACWVDVAGNLKFREVERPRYISKYFAHCNAIDAHNQARQGKLALEEVWDTQDCWFCLMSFFVGFTITDMWKAIKQHLPGNHFLTKTSIKKFAEITET